ncbi:MAG: flagellar hook capping protein [Ponticaulis sp.]|nr:flagellar hook capping protein [Ponticaulis sp.]|tara:strand:+ start:22008 stop:22667 length:660 start_codon:yes stop_codon:yes gene_type:complete
MVDAVSTLSNIQNQNTTSSATLAENFETFLTLLTAQLQNQDPLEPVDSTEFTNQLVQFAGVEQQIQTNQNIADLISITASSTAAGLASYLGKSIEIDSLSADLGADGITWQYDMPEGIDEARLAIQSSDGQIVWSEDIGETAGKSTYDWSGEALSGDDLTSGNYSLIIQAVDGQGETQNVPVRVLSRVTGVDLSNGSTSLSTPNGVFDFNQILRLTAES